MPTPNLYVPMMGVVLSGEKVVDVSGEVIRLVRGDAFVVPLTLPVVGTISQASSQHPYRLLRLSLNTEVISELQVEMPDDAPKKVQAVQPLMTRKATTRLLIAIDRMVSLLDQTEDQDILAPLYEREALYRLCQDFGPALHGLVRSDSNHAKVVKATHWLAENMTIRYEAHVLAELVQMSVPSLNRHFRHTVGMSPLEYQKHLRLHEAKRLLSIAKEPGLVSQEVGYSSPSQFSREFRRLFGISPSEFSMHIG